MKAIILILSLVSCLSAPTVRTTEDLSCAAHELLKKDCGFYGINQKTCEEKGCCWKESSVQGVPWCFHGIDDVPTYITTGGKICAIDRENRVECGYKGIDKAECESRGCCWKIDDYESIIPWCFQGYEETNIEDEFDVVTSDTNNILLVPIAKEEELTLNQVFDFLEKFSAKFVSEFDPKI